MLEPGLSDIASSHIIYIYYYIYLSRNIMLSFKKTDAGVWWGLETPPVIRVTDNQILLVVVHRLSGPE